MSDVGKRMDGLTLYDVLRHNARYLRDKIAVRIDGEELTHGNLLKTVDALVGVLSRHVAPGDRIAIWLPNSFSWIVSFLAANALGAISVPVNTRLTATELRGILKDADARMLITTSAYRGRDYVDEAMAIFADDGARPVVCAASDAAPEAWSICGDGNGAVRRDDALSLQPSDLFCIQYTSGTTSTPKGVMLTNEAYLLTASYVARCQRLTPASRFISAGPFFHCSGSMHALTVCMVAGCTLTSMSIWNPERFLDDVQTYRCDASHAIYYRDVLALGDPGARAKLASMQVAHTVGPREYLLQVHDELDIPGLSNIYGMTETAGQFSMWCPDDPLESRMSANGRPQPGNRFRIVAPDTGEAVADGEPGEIQLMGRTLSPGYYNRPEANAAALTADGWLRTGDLGAVTDDGALLYVARLKEIVRVGGENFAPAEVEQIMRDHCGVRQVCVLGVPHPRLNEVAAAVVVGGDDLEWSGILDTLTRHLAGFKIPTAIYLAPALPMTATNKVQRAVLSEWIADNRLVRVV